MNHKPSSINLSYTIVNTLLWLSASFVTGYAASYLLSAGFSSTIIGTLLSFSAVFSILLQTLTGYICDRWSRFTCRFFLLMMFAVSSLLSVRLCLSSRKTEIALFFLVLNGIHLAMETLIYTLANEYMNAFSHFHFGRSRAFGSLFSAAGMAVMGSFLSRYSIIILPLTVLVINLFCTIFTLFFLPESTASLPTSSSRTSVPHAKGYLSFFRNHRMLIPFFLGILFIYISASSVYNFQINILKELGAGSAELGISCAIGCITEVPLMFAFSFFASRFSTVSLVRAGAFFYVLKIALFTFASRVPMVYFAQIFQGPSYALLSMFSVCYINQNTSSHEKAKGQALLGMIGNGMAGIISNITAGRMMDTLGVKTTLLACLFLSGTGFLLVISSLRYTSSATQKKLS